MIVVMVAVVVVKVMIVVTVVYHTHNQPYSGDSGFSTPTVDLTEGGEDVPWFWGSLFCHWIRISIRGRQSRARWEKSYGEVGSFSTLRRLLLSYDVYIGTEFRL